MRINLVCPYSEKDVAKRLGARWDIARKTWYIVDVEDLTPFMRWIQTNKKTSDKKPSQEQNDRISLRDFLNDYYGKAVSLTFKSAKAFGIPYPLESKWAIKYASRTALLSDLSVGKNAKKQNKKRPARTGPAVFVPLCNCTTPPWEDCEHTDALAEKAFKDILG